MISSIFRVSAAVAALAGGASATGQEVSPEASFEPDGSVHIPSFNLPLSPFVSREATELQKSLHDRLAPRLAPPSPPPGADPIAIMRSGAESVFGPRAEDMMKRYPADVMEQRMGGVRVKVITPKVANLDSKRLLINLHGGGFNTCAEACPLMESLPIAFLAGMKVISIDYRMAPEHVFPAASEDVEAVYRELLNTYEPSSIGMYGCSAGGALSAQSAAWLPAKGLPQFGAIGIFGSGAIRAQGGDSVHFAKHSDGLWRAPRLIRPAGSSASPPPPPIRSYFAGADISDPMVSPAEDPSVLAKFPPALIITGTRAADMSPAVVTHARLLEAGVKSQLIVGEGMGHCYIYEAQLPESQLAYRQVARFFRENLH